MSEENAKAEPEFYNATLVRGSTYVFKGAQFLKGVARKVSPATKAYLEEHAFDDVSVGTGEEQEIERRGKFEFTVPGAPAAPARKRTRG